MTGIAQLSVTRTYLSADASIVAATPPGPFGRGWHHDWEAALSCADGACTLTRGLEKGSRYVRSGAAASLDGRESWDVYRADVGPTASYDGPGVLVRRPDGSWILFSPDGRELHFRTICDACGGADLESARCVDPLQGGRARLVKVVDAAGNAVHLGYDRPSGLVFGLFDDLGHALEARSTTACTDGLVRSLRYDGNEVVTYDYAGTDLVSATDGEGAVLRSYVYSAGSGGRLQAVLNEAGVSIAEFAYDAAWRAVGIVDAGSSTSVDYGAAGGIAVTEYFHGANGPTSQTSLRKLDVHGNVVSVSDGCACGPPSVSQYANGRLTCEVDAAGRVRGLEYDAFGRQVRSVEYAGSCPVPATLPLPSRDESYVYGLFRTVAQGVSVPLDRASLVSRPSGSAGRFANDGFDYASAAKTYDPPGYVCTTAPLPTGSAPCRQIQSGYVGTVLERHATFNTYDAHGRLVRRVGPVNLDRPSPVDVVPVEERTYWEDTAALERRGRLHEVKRYPASDAPPLVTSYDYDAHGVFQERAPDGALTTYVHDARGRVRFVLGPAGRTETRYYDGSEPRLVVLPGGAAVRSTHGAMGRLVRVEGLSGDPEASGASPTVAWSESHQYDAAGNRVVTERSDGSREPTWRQERAFDVQHRVVKQLHPELPGKAQELAYDLAGLLSATTDEEGRRTAFIPDALGRIAKVTRSAVDPQGLTTTLEVAAYAYQARGDSLASVTDGAARTTSYAWDDFGRLRTLSTETFSRGFVAFAYDARGNVLQRSFDSTTVSYTYDALDRVLSVTAADPHSSVAYTYVYDENGAAGRLTTMRDAERALKLAYDGAGRLASETLVEGALPPLVTEYRYDAAGTLSEVWYASGLRVRYVRDPANGEVVAVEDVATGARYASGVAHRPGGGLAALVFGNGLTLGHTANLRGEPLTVTSGPVSLAYTPSPAGDIAAVADAGTSRSFVYDSIDRLTASPGSFSYAHDGGGNRTAQTVAGAPLAYTYSFDRLKQVAVQGSTVPKWGFTFGYQSSVSGVIAYGANGTPQNLLCLRHDPLGRLALVGHFWRSSVGNVRPGGTSCVMDGSVEIPSARFKYDARARRIARWTAASNRWTYTISDASGNLLSELALVNGAWVRVRDYVWLDGRPLAQIEYPRPGSSFTYYFHLDHIGLPRALSNEAGQVVWSATALPYGDLVETTLLDPLSGTTVVTNLRLPGQYDERLFAAAGISGMQGPYYNWNRWYLPSVGRYLELDPLALQGGFNTAYGVDWYGYALQNPMKYWDPWGMVPCTLGDTTYTCCLKKYPGCPECCGAGEPPPKIPVRPGEPPPQPKPPPTCETQPPKQPPQPEPFKPDPLNEPGLTAGSCAARCSKVSAPLWPFCMAVCLAGGLISGPL